PTMAVGSLDGAFVDLWRVTCDGLTKLATTSNGGACQPRGRLLPSVNPEAGCNAYRRLRSTRRAALRAGVLGSLGLSLDDCLRLRDAAAGPIRRAARAKSVILIWPSGGVSHHDTFDPKPDQPSEIRGEFGTVEM